MENRKFNTFDPRAASTRPTNLSAQSNANRKIKEPTFPRGIFLKTSDIERMVSRLGTSEEEDDWIFHNLLQSAINPIPKVIEAAYHNQISPACAAGFLMRLIAEYPLVDEILSQHDQVNMVKRFILENYPLLNSKVKIIAIRTFQRFDLPGTSTLLKLAKSDSNPAVRRQVYFQSLKARFYNHLFAQRVAFANQHSTHDPEGEK